MNPTASKPTRNDARDHEQWYHKSIPTTTDQPTATNATGYEGTATGYEQIATSVA